MYNKPANEDEIVELNKYRAKYDGVFQSLGQKPIAPISNNQEPLSYRKSCANVLKQFTSKFKSLDVNSIKDKMTFGVMEDAIFADSQDYAVSEFKSMPKTVRAIKRQVGAGSIETRYIGDPLARDAFGAFVSSADLAKFTQPR